MELALGQEQGEVAVVGALLEESGNLDYNLVNFLQFSTSSVRLFTLYIGIEGFKYSSFSFATSLFTSRFLLSPPMLIPELFWGGGVHQFVVVYTYYQPKFQTHLTSCSQRMT